MAMICCNGARECDGCCQCGEPVLIGDDRYEFPDGEIVHDDCVLDFIRRYFRNG